MSFVVSHHWILAKGGLVFFHRRFYNMSLLRYIHHFGFVNATDEVWEPGRMCSPDKQALPLHGSRVDLRLYVVSRINLLVFLYLWWLLFTMYGDWILSTYCRLLSNSCTSVRGSKVPALDRATCRCTLVNELSSIGNGHGTSSASSSTLAHSLNCLYKILCHLHSFFLREVTRHFLILKHALLHWLTPVDLRLKTELLEEQLASIRHLELNSRLNCRLACLSLLILPAHYGANFLLLRKPSRFCRDNYLFRFWLLWWCYPVFWCCANLIWWKARWRLHTIFETTIW